ncbi:hypothetical protein niasHS_014519 [Heterodera schachtii]|uniref:Uncharacterized protein n=1 Tax=Heterodera schachtii TaxID=97005 RepID=A0ABD2IGP6_HETSC
MDQRKRMSKLQLLETKTRLHKSSQGHEQLASTARHQATASPSTTTTTQASASTSAPATTQAAGSPSATTTHVAPSATTTAPHHVATSSYVIGNALQTAASTSARIRTVMKRIARRR